MRVAAYTGGVNIPSARLRIRQYIAPLRDWDISVSEFPLPWGNILPNFMAMRPLWMSATFAYRIATLRSSWNSDATWISRQVLPAFIPLQRFTRSPRVLDVDDAIWLNTGGHRARDLARACDVVVCGNSFLAEQFSEWNSNVTIIPTAIDTEWIKPASAETPNREPTIGWTGTSGNFRFLYAIEDALRAVLEKNPGARLLVISDLPPKFSTIPSSRIDFFPWSPEREAEGLRQTTVGIMPLLDDDWCRGKCSFKMLCYMGSRIPVVVTPWGMNNDVLAMGRLGFGAKTRNEWVDALDFLLNNPEVCRQMGNTGRDVVTSHFSLKYLASKYAEIFLRFSKSPQKDHAAPLQCPARN